MTERVAQAGSPTAAWAVLQIPAIYRSRVTGDDQFRPRGSGRGPSASSSQESSVAEVATPCVPGVSHQPACNRLDDPRYWLYNAAWDGCLPCVRRFLEQDKVDPESRSHSQGYTVLDWAV